MLWSSKILCGPVNYLVSWTTFQLVFLLKFVHCNKHENHMLLLHISGKFLSSFIAFGFLPNFVVNSHAFIDFQNLTTLFSHVQINVHAYVRHNFFRLKFYPVERI
jgi:hypothetical protein